MNMYEENKGTLYVLGNGFDICYGLDTCPKRFFEILKTKGIYNETPLYNFIITHIVFESTVLRLFL
uniref:hypothetical protein n=1 Tax=Agathobacter sp. TaxID=2021311 RepID=UPI004055D298